MTTADINNTLSLQTRFTVGNTGTPPADTVIIKDLSVWSSIVSASTDNVNIILQIKNSAGQIVYQNAGWVASVFTSPDLFYGTSPVTTTSAKTLLYDANGDLITGIYTVESQVQVVEDFATTPIYTYGGVTYSPLLCADYLQANLNPSLTFAPNCNSKNMTVSDSTVYGAYTSITWSIKVTPPVEAAQSPFTASSNSVLVTDLWSPAPYQGEIHNVVTYGISTAQVVTISYINYFQNYVTDCDKSFCELYCCLKDLYSKREAVNGKNSATYAIYDQKFVSGLQILALCYQARDCSDEVTLASYIEQFYLATGCDKNCSCGCSDTPSPVVPVSPSQGPPGDDGVGISSVTVNGSGHLIITLTNNNQIDAGNVAGPAGADGTNGSNGSNGSGIIWPSTINPQTSTTTTGPGYVNTGLGVSDVYTETIPAGKLLNNGDEVKLTVDVLVPQPRGVGFTNHVSLKLGGNYLANIFAQTTNTAYSITEFLISVVTISSVKYIQIDGKQTTYDGSGDWEGEWLLTPFQFAWTTATNYDFVVDFSSLPSANMSRVTIIDSPYFHL